MLVAVAPQVFRSGVRTVAVYATVHDREGRLVPDLKQDDFQILDNGKPADITTFSNDVLPFTAVLMLDMSNSVLPAFFVVRDSAVQFVNNLQPQDKLRIGTFGREVAVSPILTNDKDVLTRVLTEEVWPLGPTPLWRAATEAMNSLATESGRRVILLLTDGIDGGGMVNCAPLVRDLRGAIGPCPSRSDVMKQAQTAEFMFYAIGIPGTAVAGDLVSIVEETGGGHFDLKRDEDLNATFKRVADELRHQYVLGFTPTVLDGKSHKLEVRLIPKGLTARARKSYLASAGR
jgi:Ca-activated chloride channel family protein